MRNEEDWTTEQGMLKKVVWINDYNNTQNRVAFTNKLYEVNTAESKVDSVCIQAEVESHYTFFLSISGTTNKSMGF